MSMAASIELRVPFLDHSFVEFCLSLPDEEKIRSKVQKYLLRTAMADIQQALGSPGRIRTCGPLINSELLYR